MQNIKRTLILLIIGVLFHANLLHSQTMYDSPFSKYGIGDIKDNIFYQNKAMGGISYGFNSPFNVNYNNPASYIFFDTLSMVFEAGIASDFSKVIKGDYSANSNYISPLFLNFGFPVFKWWKSAIGIMPYSNVGYYYNSKYKILNSSDGSYINAENTLRGSGGFNKLFWGNSFKIINNLSVGFNAEYMFGTISRNNTLILPDSANILGSRIYNELNLSDVNFRFGLQYKMKLKNDKDISFGLAFKNSKKLAATENILNHTYVPNPLGNKIQDTIENSSVKGSILFPTEIGGGFVLNSPDKYMIGFDCSWQQWEKFEILNRKDSMKNSLNLALGGQFIPNATSSTGYFNKIRYRFGARFSNTNIAVNGKQVNDVCVAFGFGFPLKKSRTTFNLSVELGERGTTDKNIIKEQYINFVFSISVFERWFIVRKLD